jgi:hypothetical protein
MILPTLPLSAEAATPPAISESAIPSVHTFPAGGGWASTNLSLDRNTHIRDARLTMQGDAVRVPTAYHLNATTQAASLANAWSGGLDLDAPSQPPESYIATPFNATQVTNVSALEGALATSPIAANYTYQLFIMQVAPLDVVELQFVWAGYALPPAMPIYWSGKLFLYNFTSLAWDLAGAYPAAASGVQSVVYTAASPANYIKPGTGSVAAMVASEATSAQVYTDFFEVTAFVGVWPKPAVDVGADSTIDWRWDAPGWGALGRQTEFDDGYEATTLAYGAAGGVEEASILIPEQAQLERASLILQNGLAPNSTNVSGSRLLAIANGNTSLNVSGLPMNARGDRAFARFVDAITLDSATDNNSAPQAGDMNIGSDPNGYRKIAQSFNVSQSGAISRITVFVVRVDGNPGSILMELELLNGTGIPVGSPLASAQVAQSALSNGSWIDFVFPGFSLTRGARLALQLSCPTAPPDTSTNFVKIGTSANNSFPDGEGLSYVNVTGLGSSWSRPAGADLLFLVRQDLPLSSLEASQISLDGVSPGYSQIANVTNLSFTVPSYSLSGGTHVFVLQNQNPTQVRFNWSVRLDFDTLAERLGFAVTNSSIPELVFDNLTASVEIDLVPMARAILNSSTNRIQMPNGQLFAQLLLAINASTGGQVLLRNVEIRYSLNATTADVSAGMNAYLQSHPGPSPRAAIPISIYSQGASQLTLIEAAVTYDRPPSFFGFSNTVTDEDVQLVQDLNTVFHDDYDNANLSFDFNVISGSAVAFVALRGYNLTITPYANLSGNLVVNVSARDSSGLENWSGDTTFTVLPLNDPPWITIPRLNVSWGGVTTVDLSPYLVDAESPTSSIAITSASGTGVTAAGRSLVFNFSVGASDIAINITLSDGTASATWPLLIHPRQANTPPGLRLITPVFVQSNAAYWLDLGAYAFDAEDSLAELSFALNLPIANSTAVLWSIESNGASTYLKLIPRAGVGTQLTATLTVTDRDGNTNSTSLGIQIVGAANIPPRIVGVDPVMNVGNDPVSIFLATKYADPEDNAAPERLNWSVLNDNPDLFSATIDPRTQTLLVTPVPGAVGSGSLRLVLVDSGGAQTTKTVSVTVHSTAPASSASIIVVGLMFAFVVFAAVFEVRRERGKPRKATSKLLGEYATEAPSQPAALVWVEGAQGEGSIDLPSPEGKVSEPAEDIGSFLRGLTEKPGDRPPAGDEGVATLGLHSGLDDRAAAISAAPAVAPAAKGKAHLAELYLFSIKDGGLLFQVPPKGLPLLEQVEENEFLQWAYDTVRASEKHADTVRIFDWKDQKVLIARGKTFFIAGRTGGSDQDTLKRDVKTIVEEVDHQFPGSTADWQRTDTVETVGDILRRLVKGA